MFVSGDGTILKVMCAALKSMIFKERASSPFTLFLVRKAEITVEIAASRNGGHSISLSSWSGAPYQPAIQYVM